MLPNLKNILLTLIFGLLIGAAGGYYLKSLVEKAGQGKAVADVRKIDAKNDQQVARDDAALGERQEKKDEVVNTVKRHIAGIEAGRKHLPSAAPASRADTATMCGTEQKVAGAGEVENPADSGLSVAHVRLLNAARAGTPDSSFEPSDAEIATPAAVTRAELLDNDLEIVRRYHQLAEAHDQLVSEVEKMQADQRQRLGLSE